MKNLILILLECFLFTILYIPTALALEENLPSLTEKKNFSQAQGFDFLRQRAAKDGSTQNIRKELSARPEESYLTPEEWGRFRMIDAHFDAIYTALGRHYLSDTQEDLPKLLEEEGATEAYSLYESLSPEDLVRFLVYQDHLLELAKSSRDREKVIGILKKEDVAGNLAGLLGSRNARLKAYIVTYLPELTLSENLRRRAIAYLEKFIGDESENKDVRHFSVSSLAELDPQRSDAYFRTLQSDPVEFVRSAAKRVLYQRSHPAGEAVHDGGKRYFGPEGMRIETLTRENQGDTFTHWDEDEATIQQIIRQGASKVAFVGEKLAGSYVIVVEKDSGTGSPFLNLSFLSTREEFLRQGVGRVLLYAAAQEALARHIPLLKGQIHKDNKESLDLIEAHAGFQKEGFVDNHWNFSQNPRVIIQNLLIGYLEYLQAEGIWEIEEEEGPRFSLRTSLDRAKELVIKGSLKFDLASGKWLLQSVPDGGIKYATLTDQNRGTIFRDAPLKGWSERDIYRLLRENLSKVALVDGEPVGYALNEKIGVGDFSYLHIGYIRTREDSLRRQGIARTLLYESAKEAVRRSLPLLQMEVHEDNRAMLNLAESTGFQEKEKSGAFRTLTARPEDVIREIETKTPSEPRVASDGGRRKEVTSEKLGKATYVHTHWERLKHVDDYMMEILGGKPIYRVVDFGIGAEVDEPFNTAIGPSATFFELEQKLHERDTAVELIGIDNRADVVRVNQNHLGAQRASDPNVFRNTEIFSGSFSEPMKRYPGQVDLIRAMNVLQHYTKEIRRKARSLFGQALREGGFLIEGQEGLFVTYEKRGGRLRPVALHYRETPAPSYMIHTARLFLDLGSARIRNSKIFWKDFLDATLLPNSQMTDFFRDRGYVVTARPNGLVSVSLESIPARDGGRRAAPQPLLPSLRHTEEVFFNP